MSVGSQNSGPDRLKQNEPSAPRAGDPKPPDWDALKDDVGQIAGAAVERGKTFFDAAKSQATEYVDRRKGDAAKSVVDLAQTIRDTGKTFEDRPNIRVFVDGAADGLEQLAGTIRERSFSEIYADVEYALRRRPATVAAVTGVAGFLLSRFVKASAEGLREAEFRNRAAGRAMPQRRPAAQPRA